MPNNYNRALRRYQDSVDLGAPDEIQKNRWQALQKAKLGGVGQRLENLKAALSVAQAGASGQAGRQLRQSMRTIAAIRTKIAKTERRQLEGQKYVRVRSGAGPNPTIRSLPIRDKEGNIVDYKQLRLGEYLDGTEAQIRHHKERHWAFRTTAK